MTTTNNQIEMVGGIEKAREIVSGAPACESGQIYFGVNLNTYYKNIGSSWYFWFGVMWCQLSDEFQAQMISLDDLRTAIAEHDATLTNEGTKQLESDDCTNIRNHLSPNCKVMERNNESE